jgi:hypothetical protein
VIKEVANTPLSDFEEPIVDSLRAYQDRANGSLEFDLDAARSLELTPQKPNSARSVTEVKHLGEAIGNLYVIAFAPRDGTGDENTYSAEYLSISDHLPKEGKVMPRPKDGVHSEIHLALGAKFVRDERVRPYTGHLALVGFKDDGSVGYTGHVGQSLTPFISALEGGPVEPTASLTVGQHGITGERVGDPHAVYNLFGEVVQVAGFVAVTDEMADPHAIIVQELEARHKA